MANYVRLELNTSSTLKALLGLKNFRLVPTLALPLAFRNYIRDQVYNWHDELKMIPLMWQVVFEVNLPF